MKRRTFVHALGALPPRSTDTRMTAMCRWRRFVAFSSWSRRRSAGRSSDW